MRGRRSGGEWCGRKRIGRRRSGSTFVEAALVLPVCILAVVTIVYIMMFLYSEAASQAMVHVASNAAAGAGTDTVIATEHIPRGITPYESKRKGLACFTADKGVRVRAGGLMRKAMKREISSSSYAVDEAKLIRYKDFIWGD